MPRYRALIGNLLVKGETFTTYANGRRRDCTVFRFGRRRFHLTRTAESFPLNPAQLVGQRFLTHHLVIENIAPADLPKIRARAIELCELLGLATSSPVAFLGDDFMEGHFRPPSQAVAAMWHPAMLDAALLRRFVEATWSRYHRLRRPRRLDEALHMLRLATPDGTPLELRLLLAFWALESLKASYAQHVGHLYCRGKWRDMNGPARPHRWNYPQLDFEALVREMFAQVKLRRALPGVVKLRNQIVHNGTSRFPLAEQVQMQHYAHSLLREYLFRLLGYVGPYRNFEDAEVHLNRRYVE